jgi:Zn finger protein HypA/HybF involved in hydrogenase expression
MALFDRVDAAIAPHPSTAVRALRVRIGELAGVDGDLFRTAFDVYRVERGYAAANLELVSEPAAWVCRACAAVLASGQPLRCSLCAGDVALASGSGLFLDRVEMEVMADV